METGNIKFDTLLNLIKDANEKNSKVKNKINVQIEEINKTKTIINQFEECLKQQNEMLNKLLDEKLSIKSYKNDLIKEMNKLENSDDEGYEINLYDNQDKVDSFIQINSVNIDTINDGCKNTKENDLHKCRKIDYYDQNLINVDELIKNKCKKFLNYMQDQSQTNLNMLTNCNDKPIKINPELSTTNDNNQLIKNDNFVPSQNNEISERKFLMLKFHIKIPKNKTNIFKDEYFIKHYSPKLLYKLKKDSVVFMNNIMEFFNVCCANGVLLIYNKKKNLWSKLYSGNSKNILQYMNIDNERYLFCENEFVRSSESKTEVKEFNSNIISCLHKAHKNYPFYNISLENGEIWKYDVINRIFVHLFSFHSKMKACINLPNNSSLFLTENGQVFTTRYRDSTRIPELDGCVDILTSFASIVVCYFGNGICKIYEMVNKKMFELEISESIKFARHSESTLAVLDIENRLHLYEFTKKTFSYKEIQVIQIPTIKNISAMSNVINKQIFITVKNEIYSIKCN